MAENSDLPKSPNDIIAEKQAWFDALTHLGLSNHFCRALSISPEEASAVFYNASIICGEAYSGKYGRRVVIARFFDLVNKSNHSTKVKKALGLENLKIILTRCNPLLNRQDRQHWNYALKTTENGTPIYRFFRKYNLLPEFYFILNAADSIIGKNGQESFTQWCAEEGIDLAQLLVDYEIPELSSKNPSAINNLGKKLIKSVTNWFTEDDWNKKIIDVDELVHWGDGDEGLSHVAEESQEPKPQEKEFRYEKICSLLKEIGIQSSQIQAIYRQKNDYIIDLATEAGRAQILAADYHAIYVVRDESFSRSSLPLYRSADEITQHDEEINFLIDRADVWKFNMPREKDGQKISQERMDYVRYRLKEFILTPAAHLPEQVKHRVAWANKGSKTELSVIMTVLATGQLLKTDDKKRFKYGPLANVEGATPAKANAALDRRTVAKFKDQPKIKSLRTLWAAAVHREPELGSFENTDPVTVQGILADCDRIIKEYGMVPSNDTAPALEDEVNAKIMGHTIGEIQVALRYGVLQGSGRFLLNQTDIAKNLEDLQIQAGLAKRDATTGELHPVV